MASPYAQDRSRVGSSYARSRPRTAPTSTASPSGGGGGLLGTLEHVATRGGSNLYHAAVNLPAGLFYIGQAASHDAEKLANEAGVGSAYSRRRGTGGFELPGVAKQQVEAVAHDIRHPLRNPGYTLLDVLGLAEPAAGGLARVGEAGRVAAAGGRTGDVLRAAARKPEIAPRALRSGELTVHPETSRTVIGSTGQKAIDTLLQKGAERRATTRTGRLARQGSEYALNRRISKTLSAETRIAGQVAKGPGQALAKIGSRLTPGEQKALQVVAEQAPLDQRITTASARVTGAKTAAARARHQEELHLLTEAKQHLTVADGKPALAEPKLQRVYDRMAKVAGDRETLLKQLGLLTDEAIRSRTTKAGRVAAGATHEAPTPGKLGAPSQGLIRARAYEQRVGALVDKAEARTLNDTKNPNHTNYLLGPTFGGKENPVLVRLKAAHSVAKDEVQRLERLAASKEKPTGIIGAEHFTAGPSAVRIPDVATRRGTRALNREPQLGGQGTIGHLRAPGSTTHEYTGVLREHGLRRQDTTRLVAESSLEAAKYAGLKHLHELVRQATRAEPTRPSDIAVRLDKLKPSQQMPLAVRQYLSSPEEFYANHTPAEAATVFDKVKGRLFIDPKTLDPQAAAEFEQLRKQGKIGWVPRRLLGDLAKPTAPLQAVAGRGPVRLVDAINNASRFAILYLKPAYALPNVLGNAALNLLQQGWAAPANLARSARLNAVLGEDLAARIDAAMGEGIAQAISAHGQGRFAGAVDVAARGWSKVVDTPFRRSSFLYEANKAGYRTPGQLERLLTDPGEARRLGEISLRANREIIDYSNLTPVEREIVRRVVFFYPWLKGSTSYAGRLLREHPTKAAVSAQVGRYGQQRATEALGPVPSYLEGVFPAAGGLVNPASAAILQTPAQVGLALQGLATGNIPRVAEGASFLTPAVQLALAELLRRNPSTGYAYPGGTNAATVAQDTIVGGLPQVQLYKQIRDALSGEGGSKLYPPNVRAAILHFLLGGIAPRPYSPSELARLAAQERSQMKTGR